ncbi:MAG: acyltransferase family protein, partial [Myxococcota bacterium]
MSEPRRFAGLDAARSLAVVAMVMGHSLDAVLSSAGRESFGGQLYWEFRAFTAPLFLLVSGWAVVMSAQQRGLVGVRVLRRYLPRVGLLFLLGFVLRFPAWNWRGLVHGDESVWRHFLAFDALHVIAASLLVALGVLAVVRDERVRALCFGLAAVGMPWATPWVWSTLSHAPSWAQQTLGGGDAPFPLFHWAGYFFIGAFLGVTLSHWERARVRGVIALLALAALAMLAAGPTPAAQMALASWTKFVWRLGGTLILLALAMALPERWARALAPVGRASLWVYVIHLPIVYGWALWPGLSTLVGPTLSPSVAVATALGVTAVSV